MTEDLAGLVAVVTGGASGIGGAIVERFAAEGAKVVIADLDKERGTELAARLGSSALFEEVDVSDPDRIERLVARAVEAFGGLHVMCNNAGISGSMHKDFLHDDLADFHRVLGVNLLGTMAGTRHAARHMSEHGGGSIINLSSVGGIQAGGGVQSYRASKAAVIHFTKSAAIELAQFGIRVNCIAPGNIPTPLLSSAAATMSPELAERFTRTMRESMEADRPLRVEGKPEDVAEAAVYLACERARYVTGTVLAIDGGTVAGKPLRPRRKKPVEG
ncbi:SDR family NAD(P)-dependent oxidoreductase [Nocardia bovistercoris]|uniref:SDR family oxidoreductase n=1 Tax=Nocardia bovistercoris TaxID=2785916 RepID=A0A931II97_9NOCA|nr:SDR family oxidoreductase [Nocardia bovistercoris]MBH0781093.1 SDR family oxidoreductase [Nocardia bovistercoris]